MGKQRRSAEFKNNSRVIDMEEARALRQAKRQAQQAARKKREAKRNIEETRGKRAIRRKRNRTRMMAALVVLIIIGVVIFSGFRVITLLKEKHDVEKQHEALLKQKAELEQMLENASDKQTIEDVARQELRLIKPGEVLYMFPSDFGEEKGDSEEEEVTEEDIDSLGDGGDLDQEVEESSADPEGSGEGGTEDDSGE